MIGNRDCFSLVWDLNKTINYHFHPFHCSTFFLHFLYFTLLCICTAQKWLTFSIRQLHQNIENLVLDCWGKQAVNRGVIVEESKQIFLTFESDNKSN